MNGTVLAFNNSQQEISFIEEKKLLDEERSSNQSRSLHAKANSRYFEPVGRISDMEEH